MRAVAGSVLTQATALQIGKAANVVVGTGLGIVHNAVRGRPWHEGLLLNMGLGLAMSYGPGGRFIENIMNDAAQAHAGSTTETGAGTGSTTETGPAAGSRPSETTTEAPQPASTKPVQSRYPDGTPVFEGEQPGKFRDLTRPRKDSLTRDYSGIREVVSTRHLNTARVAAPFAISTSSIRRSRMEDRDLTITAPEQHRYTPNDPNNPKAGYKRGPGEPLE